jgi:WD40 repeat protein
LCDFCECDRFVNNACLLACLKGDKETARLLFARIDEATVDQVTWKSNARYDRWRRKLDAQLDPPEETQTLDDPEYGWVLAVAFAGDKQLLTTSEAPGIHRWDLATGKIVGSIDSDKTVRAVTTDRAGQTAMICYGSRQQMLAGAAVQPLDGDPPRQILTHAGGICNAAINRIERGHTTPDFSTIRKLVVAMDAAEQEFAKDSIP